MESPLVHARTLWRSFSAPSGACHSSRTLLRQRGIPVFVGLGLAEGFQSLPSRRMRCEAMDESEAKNKTANGSEEKAEEVLSRSLIGSLPEQISVGLVLGVATGYATKRIGKALLLIVGGEIIVLQYLAFKGWLDVHWRKIAEDLTPTVNRNMFDRLLSILTYRLPFTSSFTAGLYAGLKFI